MTRSWNRTALAAAALGLGFAGSALGRRRAAISLADRPADARHRGRRRYITIFHTALVWIITVISLFVLALLVAIVVKFNEKANPVASRTTHHTGLEIAWTMIPVLILVGIAIPSFRLLKLQVELPKADMTVKVHRQPVVLVLRVPEGPGRRLQVRQLHADSRRPTRRRRTSPICSPSTTRWWFPSTRRSCSRWSEADVIHSFSVPSLGFRMDAVPGRLNQTWFKADREGIYYGQCSRLCGQNHAYMPIAVRAVSPDRICGSGLPMRRRSSPRRPMKQVKVAARSVRRSE